MCLFFQYFLLPDMNNPFEYKIQESLRYLYVLLFQIGKSSGNLTIKGIFISKFHHKTGKFTYANDVNYLSSFKIIMKNVQL